MPRGSAFATHARRRRAHPQVHGQERQQEEVGRGRGCLPVRVQGQGPRVHLLPGEGRGLHRWRGDAQARGWPQGQPRPRRREVLAGPQGRDPRKVAGQEVHRSARYGSA